MTKHESSRRRRTARVSGKSPRNGAELVAYWLREGLIGTRPDLSDSQLHARQLRDRAQRRSKTTRPKPS